MALENSPLWYLNAVFYEVYPRAFYDSNADGHGDLRGLIAKLDYLTMLGVDCIWLLPVYPSPLKDDGYDIADYTNILPAYGTIEDFKALISAAHQKGLRVVTDLVLNHTSDQHPWFQAARSDPKSQHRDYYVWSDTDKKYPQTRVIFLDTLHSNWTWDERAGQYYWHRFFPSQPDLNFENPQVQEEFRKIIHFWLELGVDGFRVDAVPYLFEREGTNCENLPETHAYLKQLRRYVDEHFKDRVLLCEANQWPKDVRAYFGESDEFQMGFHFPLMPRIFMALRKGDISSLVWVLENTPEIPSDCQWCLFLRNHDELTLEMVSDEEREWMWQEYAPLPRMRLNLGIRRRLAPLLDNDRRKIELANALIFSLPGSPIIYYGDEIGMGDDVEQFDRNGVRMPMQWEGSPSAGFSEADPSEFFAPIIQSAEFGPQRVNVSDQVSDPSSLLNRIREMITVRKAYPVFGTGSFRWVDTGSNSIAVYWRKSGDQSVLCAANLSPDPQLVRIALPEMSSALDILTHQPIYFSIGDYIEIEIPPFGYRWIEVF